MNASEIMPHDQHTVEDYRTSGHLQAEAVSVRFNREGKGRYRVEISMLDRDYTHADEVAAALESAGMVRATESRRFVGDLIVIAPKGFRAPANFVRIDSL